MAVFLERNSKNERISAKNHKKVEYKRGMGLV